MVARRQVKRIRKATVEVQSNENQSGKRSRLLDVGETKALRTVLLVLGAFVVAWLPYTVISVGKLTTRGSWDVDSSWANVVLTITLLNGCVNPFIYAAKDSRFREGLKKLWNKVHGTSPDVYSSTRTESIGARSSHGKVPINEPPLPQFKYVED